MRTAKRRRTRSKKTQIPGKRIDRLPSLLPARMLAMETQATEIKDEHMVAELDEPNDSFRELAFWEPDKLPKLIQRPLSKGERIIALQQRASQKRQLWHPDERKDLPIFGYLHVAALSLGVSEVFDLPDDGKDEEV